MKPTIIARELTDLAILPPELVTAANLLPTGARSTIVSVARTHLIRHRPHIEAILKACTPSTGSQEPA